MQAQRKTPFRTIEASDFLLPEPQRRKRIEPDAGRRAVVEDAVFEVVGAPQARHSRVNDNPPPRRTARLPAILPLATRIAVGAVAMIERQLLRLSGPVFSTMLVATFFAVFGLFGGFGALSPAKILPPAATPFAVGEISVRTEDANGMKVLGVSGKLTNLSSATVSAPKLRVMSANRKTTFGTIVLPLDEIGPSVSMRFSGRFKLAGGKFDDIAIIPETP